MNTYAVLIYTGNDPMCEVRYVFKTVEQAMLYCEKYNDEHEDSSALYTECWLQDD